MKGRVETLDRPVARAASVFADFATLTKPELTGLSVLTALLGVYLAGGGGIVAHTFITVLFGTLLVGGGAGALNQYIERREDALMKRTERRPLPALRVSASAALTFGTIFSIAGVGVLSAANLLTGALGAVTLVSYIFLYTPLKKLTPAATPVGGLPGALPPVIGWTAVTGGIDTGAVLLFAILFAWQMPHFYSLAWLYRKDYARAGYRILTTEDPAGSRTGWRMTIYSAALALLMIPAYAAGIFPLFSSIAGGVLGAGMVFASVRFQLALGAATQSSDRVRLDRARHLFYASLAYLPLLMSAILADLL